MKSEARSPQGIRQRLGVDYLLEGGVRTEGTLARIVVSLTRAADGQSVWEQSFDGRLGDALALQQAIARGIEGQIRGRLAPGGGTVAGQIRTTPEVYLLYTDARALIRKRGTEQIDLAAAKLRQAVALDPNYAPAWASLASTAMIGRSKPNGLSRGREEAVAQAKRAIQLAPNLAEAYAALAFVQGPSLPSSDGLLRRAVALNPDNSEAWNWLGNSLVGRGEVAQAAAAWERAASIDPYYLSPLINFISQLTAVGDAKLAREAVERIARTHPDPTVLDVARAELSIQAGNYSHAIGLMRRMPPGGPLNEYRRGQLGELWLRLGDPEEAGRVWSAPSWFAAAVRGTRIPPMELEGRTISPRDFWLGTNYGVIAARAMVLQGRADLLVQQYRRGFKGSGDFIETLDAFDLLDMRASLLAIALIKAGDRTTAAIILGQIERQSRDRLAKSPGDRQSQWGLARVRAVQGDRSEAIRLIVSARHRGWLPDGNIDPIDIAREPVFAGLVGDRAFEAVRHEILEHVAREQREVAEMPNPSGL